MPTTNPKGTAAVKKKMRAAEAEERKRPTWLATRPAERRVQRIMEQREAMGVAAAGASPSAEAKHAAEKMLGARGIISARSPEELDRRWSDINGLLELRKTLVAERAALDADKKLSPEARKVKEEELKKRMEDPEHLERLEHFGRERAARYDEVGERLSKKLDEGLIDEAGFLEEEKKERDKIDADLRERARGMKVPTGSETVELLAEKTLIEERRDQLRASKRLGIKDEEAASVVAMARMRAAAEYPGLSEAKREKQVMTKLRAAQDIYEKMDATRKGKAGSFKVSGVTAGGGAVKFTYDAKGKVTISDESSSSGGYFGDSKGNPENARDMVVAAAAAGLKSITISYGTPDERHAALSEALRHAEKFPNGITLAPPQHAGEGYAPPQADKPGVGTLQRLAERIPGKSRADVLKELKGDHDKGLRDCWFREVHDQTGPKNPFLFECMGEKMDQDLAKFVEEYKESHGGTAPDDAAIHQERVKSQGEFVRDHLTEDERKDFVEYLKEQPGNLYLGSEAGLAGAPGKEAVLTGPPEAEKRAPAAPGEVRAVDTTKKTTADESSTARAVMAH